MRRFLIWAAVAGCSLVLFVPAAQTPAQATTTSAFSFNWVGGATSPVLWSGQGAGSNWDVQIHHRSVGDTMDAMTAQHGSDCAPPPATHPISTLAQGVYICRNHVMTAINAGDYGEIALTPDRLVDFSSGSAVIQVSVSTLQLNPSDWIEIWISPFGENETLPFTGHVDLQGPPRDALRFSLNHSGDEGTYAGDIARYDNFVPTSVPRVLTTPLDTLVPPSAVTRTTYEIDLSATHVRFGLPGVGAGGTWWANTNLSPLSFSRGIVQLVHHSYNPNKHCPTCGVDTWHWSGFSISSAIPFTLLPANERSIHAGAATTAHFAGAAPAYSYLRFSGIGTISVSFDGGHSWVAAQKQAQRDAASDHFSTYWTAIPAGTQQVMFSGLGWYGGPWWVRDPAIWSDGSPHAAQSAPPTNPPAPPTSKPTAGPGSAGSGTGSTGSGTGSGSGSGTGSGETGKAGSGDPDGASKDPDLKLVARLIAAVNPTQNPLVTIILLCLTLGAGVAMFRVLRS